MHYCRSAVVGLQYIFLVHNAMASSSWWGWWTYEGISGPDYWGLAYREWYICSKGKHQSPINIEPKTLLFDPNLKHIHIDKHRVHGYLTNTGHDVTFYVDQSSSPKIINITGGPFSYTYRVTEIHLHFGSIDNWGSEHSVDGYKYPAEIQILGYNSDLYSNMSEAETSPAGLAIVSLLAKVDRTGNKEFEKLLKDIRGITYKGDKVKVSHLSIHELLPPTQSFMTYDGSLTWPGCYETVTWVIMNKPMYMTRDQISSLRDVKSNLKEKAKVPMVDNVRPTVSQNHRVVRTNINFAQPGKGCNMERNLKFKANIVDNKP
ncbi:carbonic anhydrase-related protein 10 [Lingula anatina]|uniref:Carbonic anhydrase-related protein 10 n=1 Tax=Lingula anatina TaxID=7574 RepID=A0A1S3JDH1_LINAN|nr:carbonic anhydrase-related protein 10 [Lingula anatina]|eukprot:XP_013408373.1 carbonic anhydrase-related protein 10 [Lingula anatina]